MISRTVLHPLVLSSILSLPFFSSVPCAVADDLATPTPTETPLPPEPEEQVTLGVIASQGTFGQFAQVVSDTGGGAPGETSSVLLGSVRRVKEGVCVGRIQNSGLKTYKVNLAVEGFDEKGKRIFTRNRRATLKPGQYLEKKIFGCVSTSNLTLNLKSAKERKATLIKK